LVFDCFKKTGKTSPVARQKGLRPDVRHDKKNGHSDRGENQGQCKDRPTSQFYSSPVRVFYRSIRRRQMPNASLGLGHTPTTRAARKTGSERRPHAGIAHPTDAWQETGERRRSRWAMRTPEQSMTEDGKDGHAASI
jgi:hypothetical protein